MKFWKKKDKGKKTTNPFEEQSDSSSYSTEHSQTPTANADTYGGGGGRYGNAAATTFTAPPAKDDTQNRRNLFGGYQEPSSRYDSSGQEDSYGASKFSENDEDQEVVQIQNQIRSVKQDTLASTRNALQKISETEATAANTMNMLGTQSTQIANVDRNVDLSKAYSDRAADQAGELKQLNRSIFIPVVKNPFTKGARNRKAMDRITRDHDDHMAERDNIRQFEYDSSVRIEDAQRKAMRLKGEEGYHRGRSQSDRNRYQFEADEEDDAIEDEIDSNLDLLGDATARLRAMATTMNDELDSQNKQLSKLNKKVDPINAKLMSTTYTLNSTR
ncbi:synaptosome-associated protein 25 [Mucor ambiguus]|uniref:Synaptosome-associated protein 25 n=1 Tax=Mucor ambiguus TaxID=91626 RepID=A0A0C9M6S1_9FUNG|nr:synaptosome-associated protein 25 [Mucor ambiguus]